MRSHSAKWSLGRVFDRPIGLIRGGTRPTAPVHDGKCGANALRAIIVGNWREPSGESRTISVKSMPPESISQTICDVIRHWAERNPNKPAFIAEGQAPLTYGALAQLMDVFRLLNPKAMGCPKQFWRRNFRVGGPRMLLAREPQGISEHAAGFPERRGMRPRGFTLKSGWLHFRAR